MVDATLSLLIDLINPVANLRRQVMFSGPWPVRIVHRSSFQFQSSMKWWLSTPQWSRLNLSSAWTKKPLFKKKHLKSRKIIFKNFFSRGKIDLFAGLPSVIRHYAYKSQIPGAPSLWITLRQLSKKRQAASFCCSLKSLSLSMSRLMVPSFWMLRDNTAKPT